jgi:hypothetical protein
MVQPTSTTEEQDAKLVNNLCGTDAWRWISTYVKNSSASELMNVDGSGGNPDSFFYTPPSPYNFFLSRLIFYMQANTAMSPENFGDLAALGEGVKFVANGILISTWQTNIDIYTEMYDLTAVANISDVGADTTVSGRWTAWKDLNDRSVIIPEGKQFEIVINDDLSSLVEFRAKVKGHLVQS